MRFHHLRPGARFRYKEKVYRKISPLKGVSETDQVQRLIPRSAEVTPVDEQGRAVATELPESIDRGQLEAGLAHFMSKCDQAILRFDPPLTETQQTELRRAIRAAGEDLLTRLALGS